MTLFRMASPQHTYLDWLKVVTVSKYNQENQAFNVEILNNQHIKNGTRLTLEKGEIYQRLLIKC